jgi:hypothetical protein
MVLVFCPQCFLIQPKEILKPLITLSIAVVTLAGCAAPPPVHDLIADEKLSCAELASESKKMSEAVAAYKAGRYSAGNIQGAAAAENRGTDLFKIYQRKQCGK